MMGLLRRWYEGVTRNARVDSRNLNDWCDYSPAHRISGRKFTAVTDGHQLGQACWRHYGALLRDFGSPVQFLMEGK